MATFNQWQISAVVMSKGIGRSSGRASAASAPAVNQVVSVRMARKQQMRWTDEGVHVVALVRVIDLMTSNRKARPHSRLDPS